MPRRINLTKRGREWVVTINKRTVYANGNYAKAVGVFDFLNQRAAVQSREVKWAQAQFKAQH